MGKLLKVMVAEEGNEFGASCAAALRSNGFEVQLVPKDGTQVLRLARQNSPDVLVIDAFMPGLDAIGVLNGLSGTEKRPLVAVTTANSNPRLQQEIIESGADYYFIKPFDMQIFAERITVRVINSRGTDVRYLRHSFRGEFVAQCAFPQDVELYRRFEYDTPDEDALRREAEQLIAAARDRSRADGAPKAGEYSMIISGPELATLLSAYAEKADASMIYAGYSNYAIGCAAQGGEVSGEKLNLTLRARVPYSAEGVPMTERELLKDGELQTIHGSTRFCRYLGVEPTGSYGSLALDAGAMGIEQMKKEGVIYPVAFSDFQMDAFTGHFGGEIRLAYVYDKDGMHIVTGGSVSGSLFEAQKDMAFSVETYNSAEYSGPFAALISRVSVAGA